MHDREWLMLWNLLAYPLSYLYLSCMSAQVTVFQQVFQVFLVSLLWHAEKIYPIFSYDRIQALGDANLLIGCFKDCCFVYLFCPAVLVVLEIIPFSSRKFSLYHSYNHCLSSVLTTASLYSGLGLLDVEFFQDDPKWPSALVKRH